MKIIPNELSRGNATLHQIKREANVAIYERRKNGKPLHFEVIRIRSHDGREIHGSFVPASEYYPGDEAWGRDGFTVMTMERAEAKMAEIHAHNAELEAKREKRKAA